MNAKSPLLHARHFICVAAAMACAALSATIQAKDYDVIVTVPVSTVGLDSHDPASVRELYHRLRLAAATACGPGTRVGMQPPANFAGCYEKALGEAVRSVHWPQLSIVYLATHTLHDAARYGIEVPARMAAQ